MNPPETKPANLWQQRPDRHREWWVASNRQQLARARAE